MAAVRRKCSEQRLRMTGPVAYIESTEPTRSLLRKPKHSRSYRERIQAASLANLVATDT